MIHFPCSVLISHSCSLEIKTKRQKHVLPQQNLQTLAYSIMYKYEKLTVRQLHSSITYIELPMTYTAMSLVTYYIQKGF